MTARDLVLARFSGRVTDLPGDGPAPKARTRALVPAGDKPMTREASDRALADGLPVPGRIDIALDPGSAPAPATRTLRVERIACGDMDAPCVAAPGEEHHLDRWRQGCRACRTGAGRVTPDLPQTVKFIADLAPRP